MKDEYDEDEKFEETSFISHISKNNKWMIYCGYSPHMTYDISKLENLSTII